MSVIKYLGGGYHGYHPSNSIYGYPITRKDTHDYCEHELLANRREECNPIPEVKPPVPDVYKHPTTPEVPVTPPPPVGPPPTSVAEPDVLAIMAGLFVGFLIGRLSKNA